MNFFRIKRLVQNIANKSDGSVAPYVGLDDIESGSGRLNRGLTEKSDDDAICHIEGDVLFGKLRPYLAKAYLAHEPGIGSGELLVLRSGGSIDPRFLLYLTLSSSWLAWANATSYGTKMPRTSWEGLGDHRVWIPGMEEQRRIADFLDLEVGNIDALVSVFERMKLLMEERFQRVVDDLVDERMNLIPIRHMVKFREGPGIMASDFRDEGVPLIRISGLKGGEVTLRGCNYLDKWKVETRWKHFRLRLGDYLVSGSATMGEVSMVVDPSVEGAIPYTGLIILRPENSDVHMDYVANIFRSSLFFRQVDILKSGATMQHFGPSHLAQVKAPFPSYAKQRSIAERANEARGEMVKARELINRQTSLLNERRQALITAAVTGQIDVTTARGADVA